MTATLALTLSQVNTYKNKSPFTAKVISTKRIVGPKATGASPLLHS